MATAQLREPENESAGVERIRVLREQGARPLLDADQERALGRAVEQAQATLVATILHYPQAIAVLRAICTSGHEEQRLKNLLNNPRNPQARAHAVGIVWLFNEPDGLEPDVETLGRLLSGCRVNANCVHRMRDALADAGGVADPKLETAWSNWRAAINELVTPNLRLVARYATSTAIQEIGMEDMFAEGVMGLVRAAERYDVDRCTRFSTSAVWWIRNAMNRARHKHRDTVKRSPNLYQRAARITDTAAALEREQGRQPTETELAARTGHKLDHVREAFTVHQRAASIEEHAGMPADTLTTSECPATACEVSWDQRAVTAKLRQLPADYREVLVRHYGLGGRSADPHTFKQVGVQMGLSQATVRDMHRHAIEMLRRGASVREEDIN